jgi:hypothetical protein
LHFAAQSKEKVQYAQKEDYRQMRLHMTCLLRAPVTWEMSTDSPARHLRVPCSPYAFKDPVTEVKGIVDHPRVLQLFQKYLIPPATDDEIKEAEEPEYMQTGAAAIALGHVEATIRAWCKHKKVDCRMTGARYMINIREARIYDAAQRHKEQERAQKRKAPSTSHSDSDSDRDSDATVDDDDELPSKRANTASTE